MRRNLDFIRGYSESFSGTLRAPDGTPVDLTDANMTWRMGSQDRQTTFETLTEQNGGVVVTDAKKGAWTVTIKPNNTNELRAGYYSHQGEAKIGEAVFGFTNGKIRLLGDLPNVNS